MAVSLFFLLLFLKFFPFTSSTTCSLSKGRSLSVENGKHVLMSPNGVFSAGFYPVGENAYCFAIWFNMPSNDSGLTLVWMANRDQPVNGRRSKLSLLKNGNLILTDAGQIPIWATSTASNSSLHLQLHNSGNLVLHNFEGRGLPLWQSFDSPTDTLLPGQPLTRYVKLVSSRSKSNISSGYYKLFFDDDNVLRLLFYGPQTSSIYWPDSWILSDEAGRSRFNDTRIAVFDSRGYFKSSDLVEFTSFDFGIGPKRRLTLDFDGNLRLYSLDGSKKIWSVCWQAMSKPCRIHNACGPNGICTYDPASGRKCSCPPWFKIKNHTDWSSGCEPEFSLKHNNGNVVFLGLPQTDFYGYNLHILRNFTFDNCKKKCLELRHCIGFHYRFKEDDVTYNCYPKWQLRNGHSSPNFGGTMYVKLPESARVSSYNNSFNEFKLDCPSSIITKPLDRDYQETQTSVATKDLLWIACAIGCIEAISIMVVCYFLFRRQQLSVDAAQGYFFAVTGFKRFTYAELKKATQGFTEEIGRGGAGIVYKGVLSDQRVAAIKRLSKANYQGEAEFLAEINTIGRLNHMNLIEMWGYCAEGKHRLLVYEYMERRSLAENLQYNNALDWDKRFKIAMGTAKGLAYLHEECLEWVLHCDVKPQNILLDSDYQPKVSDFGLSKLLSRGDNQHNISSFSRIRGTRGYMAPEWVFNLPITSKVDVYSYGVVLLEMVIGRNPTIGVHTVSSEGEAELPEQGSLVTWVRQRIKGSLGISEIMDSLTDDTHDRTRIQLLIEVALQCVEEDREARPTMTQIVERLVRGTDQ